MSDSREWTAFACPVCNWLEPIADDLPMFCKGFAEDDTMHKRTRMVKIRVREIVEP